MHGLSNVFAVLDLVGDDELGETITFVSSKNDHNAIRSGGQELEKGETSGCNRALKNEETQDSLEVYDRPLVWIDLEMTGLNVEVDRILEIACIITDGKLKSSVEGPDLVIKQPTDYLDNMGEWCQEHHAASGLTENVLQSVITEQDAEKEVIEFVRKHVGSYTPLLAGNSVYVDLLFLKKYMPDLASMFSHAVVDVSSVAALCSRWYPKARKKAPSKHSKHRAMDDIKESIKELKYYKGTIFKSISADNK